MERKNGKLRLRNIMRKGEGMKGVKEEIMWEIKREKEKEKIERKIKEINVEVVRKRKIEEDI